jgi:hypothetical protein
MMWMLANAFGLVAARASTAPSGVWKGRVGAWSGVGTLLGPERTRECFPQRETTGRSPSANHQLRLVGVGCVGRCLVVL